MTGAEPGEALAHSVLLAVEDAFESGYVAAVLAERGIAVRGPFVDAHASLQALETGKVRAAVIARPHSYAGDGLVDALRGRGIPYLTLGLPPRHEASDALPQLERPFAAYQVADWVMEVFAQPA